jgi:hypothetical protein
VKKLVLKKFQNYFDNQLIRGLFLKVFSLLNIFDSYLNKFINRRMFSRPSFFKILPLVESFFIIIKIFYDDESLVEIQNEGKVDSKAELSKFKENLISEEE